MRSSNNKDYIIRKAEKQRENERAGAIYMEKLKFPWRNMSAARVGLKTTRPIASQIKVDSDVLLAFGAR